MLDSFNTASLSIVLPFPLDDSKSVSSPLNLADALESPLIDLSENVSELGTPVEPMNKADLSKEKKLEAKQKRDARLAKQIGLNQALVDLEKNEEVKTLNKRYSVNSLLFVLMPEEKERIKAILAGSNTNTIKFGQLLQTYAKYVIAAFAESRRISENFEFLNAILEYQETMAEFQKKYAALDILPDELQASEREKLRAVVKKKVKEIIDTYFGVTRYASIEEEDESPNKSINVSSQIKKSVKAYCLELEDSQICPENIYLVQLFDKAMIEVYNKMGWVEEFFRSEYFKKFQEYLSKT